MCLASWKPEPSSTCRELLWSPGAKGCSKGSRLPWGDPSGSKCLHQGVGLLPKQIHTLFLPPPTIPWCLNRLCCPLSSPSAQIGVHSQIWHPVDLCVCRFRGGLELHGHFVLLLCCIPAPCAPSDPSHISSLWPFSASCLRLFLSLMFCQ